MDWRQWGVVLIPIVSLTGYYLFRGPWEIRMLVAFPLLLLGVLFAIEILHPANISWQVGTSWDRLTLQVLPLAILSVFTRAKFA